MLGRWPSFDLVRRSKDMAAWRGALKPIFVQYEIGIFYRVPGILEAPSHRHQPIVRVLSPRLKPRADDPEGNLPHVYPDGTASPPLCLFDLEAREWNAWKLLAETTVPWAIDWLACYEGWRATGTWAGGGRHPGEERSGQ
ncbi:hypothetical protein ASG43_21525 [Aureimonas sp. Leaf454]|uniref:hypothetical protein n=1 Tax=Aureimonas sp. Leaf454 TaxID=1736381 RepID=UPI0006FF5312|nr:hypothetical protein [Aureimonas sp. Leaf454]KQT51188.1 hypothetical protein ASG43_21525 [Aureimonas sp. Leaf454]